MLSRCSEDEMWSRVMFELLLWPQEVTLAKWTQPSGPLCLWQCFIHKYQWNLWEKRKKDWNLYEEVDEIGDIGKFWVFVPLLFRWKSTNGLHMFPEWFCTESECSYWGHIQCHCRRTRQLIKIEKAINQFPLQNFSNQEICQEIFNIWDILALARLFFYVSENHERKL